MLPPISCCLSKITSVKQYQYVTIILILSLLLSKIAYVTTLNICFKTNQLLAFRKNVKVTLNRYESFINYIIFQSYCFCQCFFDTFCPAHLL